MTSAQIEAVNYQKINRQAAVQHIERWSRTTGMFLPGLREFPRVGYETCIYSEPNFRMYVRNEGNGKFTLWHVTAPGAGLPVVG